MDPPEMLEEVVLDTHDELVDYIMNFNTDPRLHPGPDLRDAPPEFPIHFYDRHIDATLALRRVKIVPNLVNMLSDFCDKEFQRFCATTKARFSRCIGQKHESELLSSHDYASIYNHRLANFCLPFASALNLHSDSKKWEAVTTFATRSSSRNRGTTFVKEGFLTSHPLYMTPYDPRTGKLGIYLPDKSDVQALYEISTHTDTHAMWHFYPMNMSGEKLLNQMADDPHFRWQTSCASTPHPAPIRASQRDPDGPVGFAASFIDKFSRSLSRRPQSDEIHPKRKRLRDAAPSAARRDYNSKKPYRVDWKDFVQHAWAQAVEDDVTFIILSCGKYERIGIRHRASRTLFLSGIIKTTICKSPSYGKLHLGLHFAIMEDSLARHAARKAARTSQLKDTVPPEPTDKTATDKLKRQHESDETESQHRSKRAKSDDEDDTFLRRKVYDALSKRDLLLVNLNYGVYQSPAPASFIRRTPSCAEGFYTPPDKFTAPKRRKSYRDDEYVTLTLEKSFSKGATGTVHRASAEVTLPSGEIISYRVVIKLVFLDRVKRLHFEPRYSEKSEEERLLHEYVIYQHLASVGCSRGILPVFGIFDDIDSGALALVMEDGGTSLHRLGEDLDSPGGIFALKEEEGQYLLDAMEKIHKAGVCHLDIRLPNILKKNNSEFYIIDFDLAKLEKYPSERMGWDTIRLKDIVNGTNDEASLY